MSIEEIIKVLEKERACVARQGEDGCDRDCVRCDLVMDDKVILGAYDTAISLLRTHQDNQPNEPLTLEELRGMGGEPGWCKEYKCWGLISVCSSGRRAHIPYFKFCKNGITWANNAQKMNLTIYRRPPKEEV